MLKRNCIFISCYDKPAAEMHDLMTLLSGRTNLIVPDIQTDFPFLNPDLHMRTIISSATAIVTISKRLAYLI